MCMIGVVVVGRLVQGETSVGNACPLLDRPALAGEDSEAQEAIVLIGDTVQHSLTALGRRCERAVEIGVGGARIAIAPILQNNDIPIPGGSDIELNGGRASSYIRVIGGHRAQHVTALLCLPIDGIRCSLVYTQKTSVREKLDLCDTSV